MLGDDIYNRAAGTGDDALAEIYARIMSHGSGQPNCDPLAKMLASFCVKNGDMPARLGLASEAFEAMMAQMFPGIALPQLYDPTLELDFSSLPEYQDLKNLLSRYDAGRYVATVWIVDAIVAGCAGQDHLWEDLGLWSRQDLSELLALNFPQLAAKNDRNMKWKKFLYKQLCVEEGVYVCRAPSCEVCRDYSVCFGPEE